MWFNLLVIQERLEWTGAYLAGKWKLDEDNCYWINRWEKIEKKATTKMDG